jgi:hypothetical protein
MNWKDPPADSGKLWLNKSIEIQVMLACNWDCPACDQFSQFPQITWVKKGTMTVAQIEYFAQEMRTTNSYFGRVRLVGGEPSLHPKLPAIVDLLNQLVAEGHVGQLEIVTNGSHPEKIQAARGAAALRVRTSGNSEKEKHHTANLLHTPVSLGYEGKACSAPWHCGISLNTYGYFPCSSGAGIARVEDWMKWQRLTLPTCVKPCNAVRETWPDLESLCGHCYHALKSEDKVKCGLDAAKNEPGEHIKPILDEWKAGRQPTWAVYGASVPAEAV